MTTVDWEIEQYNLCAVQRFADDRPAAIAILLAEEKA